MLKELKKLRKRNLKDNANQNESEKKEKNEKEEKEKISKIYTIGRAFALASTITFQLAVPVLMGAFGGRYIDERLGTSPWLMIAGLFLGLTAGVVGVIRLAQRFF
jgi:ATP synthase protein I